MIDYKGIIDGLSTDKIIFLLRSLGSEEYIEHEDYIQFKTICHNQDIESASMKLYYYKNTHLFVCYSNCGTMSIFTLMKHIYEERGIEYDWYKDIYKVILDCSFYEPQSFLTSHKYLSQKDQYKKREQINLPIYDKNILNLFIKYYPEEWLQDGISKESMDKFNIRFSISQNKIIIPHYNINGELVGIRGRALNLEEVENFGKYAPIKIEETWYSHPLSMNLYGLYENKENIKKNQYCILAEGEKSVLQANSFDRPNCCCAVCGSNLNKFALNILLKECAPREIIIAFDNEEKGKNGEYFNKLHALCQKYRKYANFSFIYDGNGLLNLKDSPFDKGQEVFEELLAKRRIVK